MFSLSCILILLIAFGANGQTNDINNLNYEKGYPFGKLRLAEEGHNEELIPSHDMEMQELTQDLPARDMPISKQDLSEHIQPLQTPCVGARPLTKLAFPKDKTKFIHCRDEYHYEITTCPNRGSFNEQTSTCEYVAPLINKCEQEKPCLNDGLCQVVSNSTFKCNCKKDWTGDRCETPLNSCVTKPCGASADCRSLKTADYEQDYVCVCHGLRGYGLNCQEIVPNPCLTTTEQFYPFAFSQRAYIQCDGELIHFQPCGASLFWNQEDKFCDRKRPPKPKLPTLVPKPVAAIIKEIPREEEVEEDFEDVPVETTTIAQIEQSYSYGQKGKDEKETLGFIPARVANRQQLLSNVANQQTGLNQNLREKELNTQDLSNQFSQSVDTTQIRQDFASKQKQWPTQSLEMNLRQPVSIQSGRVQQLPQEIRQQWVPSTTTTTTTVRPVFAESEIDEEEFEDESHSQNVQPQQNQAFGSKQWLNHLPDMKTQNNQRFVSQTIQNQPIALEPVVQNGNRVSGFSNQNIREQENSWKTKPLGQVTGNQALSSSSFTTQNLGVPTQQWQGSETLRNQQRLPEQSVQTSVETTTLPIVIVSQGSQNQNTREFENTWQNRPVNHLMGTKLSQPVGFNSQNFAAQPQTWQNTQSQLNQQQLSSKFPEVASTLENKNRFNSGLQSNNQQLWQNKNTNQLRQNLNQVEELAESHEVPSISEQTHTTQFLPNQRTQTTVSEVTTDFNNGRLSKPNVLPLKQETQRFVAQPQSWQNKNTNQLRQNLNQVEELTESHEVPSISEQTHATQFLPNQRTQTTVSEVTTDFTNGRLSKPNVSPLKQETETFGNQQRFNRVQEGKEQNTQRFVGQPQSWQTSETVRSQPMFLNQNQQSSFETSDSGSNTVRSQGIRVPQEQEHSWQSQPIKSQTDTMLVFKPTSWAQTPKQEATFKPQSWTQNQPTTFTEESSQFGLNQPQKGLPVQTSQSWSNNQQMQKTQFTDVDESKIQGTSDFAARPVGTSLSQNLRERQTSRPVERIPQESNTVVVQQTTERKTIETMPTQHSASWQTRQ
ncbi:unnamed protein product [Adineta steineri]|uniref:Uncharacterized protein n=1 Tax=Adineta steineri TaxID=433720 RepID=A0A814R2H2_9BILA|nr:unnamed protein product [Adineta steineri]